MTSEPLVTLCQSLNGTQFWQGAVGGMPCTLQVGWGQTVSRVSPPDIPLQLLKQCSIEDVMTGQDVPDLFFYLKATIESYIKACDAIGKKLDYPFKVQDLSSMERFTKWLKNQKVDQLEELDLSGLGLHCLPPQIGLFTNLKTLDIRGNSLNVLPPELSPEVKLIDDSPGLQELDPLNLAQLPPSAFFEE